MSDGLVDWDDVGKQPAKKKITNVRKGKKAKKPMACIPPNPPVQAVVCVPVPQPILIPDNVPPFEREYHLPLLLGTPRQVDWGRIVRRDFLSELFPQLMMVTQGKPEAEAKTIYEAMDVLRNERQAKVWIEKLRQHVGDAISCLLAMPKALEEARQQREREEAAKLEQKRKAAEGRRIAKDATAFAEKYGLPEILSPCESTPQANYGRRCRFELLSALSDADLAAILPAIRDVNDAGVWIGAKDQTEPLKYVMEQIEKRVAKVRHQG